MRLVTIFFIAGCHATAAQWGQTGVDAAKVGACIGIALDTGADPLTCFGATEQLVTDIINDIEAKQTLSADKRAHLESEKTRMASRMQHR